ncbi:MAG: hypothetical protein DRP45_11215, partial [Candidatus Zixiibacteriota bacterium]
MTSTSTVDTNAWLITPAIDLTSNSGPDILEYYIRFSSDFADSDEFKVMISTDGGSTWNSTPLKTYSGSQTTYTWISECIDLTAYNSYNNVKIAFWGDNNPGGSYNYIYLDDVRIRQKPDHDVSVDSLNFITAPFIVSEAETIRAYVYNWGANTETFDVILEVNGSQVSSATVTFLASGASSYVDLTWTPSAMGVDTLVVYSDLSTDQNPANDTISTTVNVATHSDSIDYYIWKDMDAAGGPSYNWVEISGTGNILTPGDDGEVRVALPFTFPYFNQAFDSITIGSNGGLDFTDTDVSLGNAALPSSSQEYFLAPFWDDLRCASDTPTAGSDSVIYYQAFGTDSFVVQWDSVPRYGSSRYFTFEVILYANGDIKFQYQDMSDYDPSSENSTIGIQDSGATALLLGGAWRKYLNWAEKKREAERIFKETGDASLLEEVMSNEPPYPGIKALGDRYVNYTYDEQPFTPNWTGYAIQFYYNPPALDVGVVSIDNPLGYIAENTSSTPSVTVHNFGSTSQTFYTHFLIDSAGVNIYHDSAQITVAGGADYSVSFSSWTAGPAGNTYDLTAYTALAGDGVPGNDTSAATVTTVSVTTMPLTEDFESGFVKFVNAPGNVIDWTINTSLYHGGTQSAHNAYNTYDNNVLIQYAWLDLSSAVHPILSFWHIAKTEGDWDHCYVEYSTDGGVTWDQLPQSYYLGNGVYEDPQYNNPEGPCFDEDSYTEWADSTPDNTWWKKERFDLGAFVGETDFMVRFRLVSDGSISRFGWLVDDISIDEAPANDMAARKVTYDPFFVRKDSSVTISARIYNAGSAAQTNVPVYCEVPGQSFSSSYTISSIAANETLTVTFPDQWVPSDTGYFDIIVYTDLTGDADPSNDTAKTAVHVWPSDIIFGETFDEDWGPYGDNPPPGWTIEDHGDESPATWNTNDWHRYEHTILEKFKGISKENLMKKGAPHLPAPPGNKQGTDYLARVYYSPIENQDEWLITPELDLSGYTTLTLQFWHYYYDYYYDDTDTGFVDVSTDGGSSWTNLTYFTGAINTGIVKIGFSGSSQTKIRFRYVGNDDMYWLVDDVLIQTYTPVVGDVLINEFAPKDSPEWIELYNPRNYDIDLTGWILTDGSGADTLSGTIAAGSYLVHNDNNFNLNSSGGSIYLISPQGDTIDQVSYGNKGGAPIAPQNMSVARAPDGTDTGYDAGDFTIDPNPTPGAANDAVAPQLGTSLVINELNAYDPPSNDAIE